LIQNKRYQFFILSITALLCLLSAVQLPKLEFNGDIHQVFKTDQKVDPYVVSIKSQFIDTTKTIVLLLKNDTSVFEKSFFKKVSLVSKELESLSFSEKVYSISTIENINITRFFIRQDSINKDLKFFKGYKDIYKKFVGTSENNTIVHIQVNKTLSESDIQKIKKCVSDLFAEYYLLNGGTTEDEFHELMKNDMLLLYCFAIVFIIIILLFFFKSIYVVISTLIIVVLTSLFTLSLFPLLNFSLHPMTIMVPTIASIISLSDVIHLLSGYQLSKGVKSIRIIDSWTKIKKPVFLTSFTTLIGFLSLGFTNVTPLIELGISVSIAVVFAYFLSVYLLPVFMTICPEIENKTKVNFSSKLTSNKSVFIGFLLFVIISLFASKIEINANLFDDITVDQKLCTGLKIVEDDFSGIRSVDLIVTSKIGFDTYEEVLKLEELVHFGDSVFGWKDLDSYSTSLKRRNRWLNNGLTSTYELNEEVAGILDPSNTTSDFKSTIIAAKIGDIGSLQASNMELDLVSFGEELGFEIVFYGRDHLFDITNKKISEKLFYGLGFALSIVTLIFWSVFKSLKITIISLIVNVFPLVAILGVMSIIGLDLNIATASVFTIAFGIAVDDSIHLLWAYNQSGNIEDALNESGNAILRTSIILSFGFGIMLLSDFVSIQQVGAMLCLSLVFAVLSDLILLPSLLRLFEKKGY
jgi:predicted RND superfamily exporter protein